MPADPSRPDPEPKKKTASGLSGGVMGDVAPYLGLGIEIMVAMVFFVLLGYFADGWLGTSPWLLLVGSALGLFATGVTLWRAVRDMDARARRRKRDG